MKKKSKPRLYSFIVVPQLSLADIEQPDEPIRGFQMTDQHLIEIVGEMLNLHKRHPEAFHAMNEMDGYNPKECHLCDIWKQAILPKLERSAEK